MSVSPEQRVVAEFYASLKAVYAGLLSNFVVLKPCNHSCPVYRLAVHLYKYKLAAGLAVYDENHTKLAECCGKVRNRACIYEHCRHIGIILPALTLPTYDGSQPHYNVQLGVDIIAQHILVDSLRELARLRSRQQLSVNSNNFKDVAALFAHAATTRSYIMTEQTATRLKLYLTDFDAPSSTNKIFRPACRYLVRRYWRKCRILIVRVEHFINKKREQLQQLLPFGCVLTVELQKRPVHYHYDPCFRLYQTAAHTHFVADVSWVGTYLLNDKHPAWIYTLPVL